MRALLANMGFVLQISGLFIILPIIVSFIYNEFYATIALFIAATAFLAFGFLLNALCERRELSYKESCTLIVMVFIVLSIVGAVPYMYLNISNGDAVNNFTDSVFEAASGFTTTGFTVVSNISLLPKSIIMYRALTQFVGGIGIVLVLLAFFYPDEKLYDFSRGMGFTVNHKIKKTFYMILVIYCIYTFIMIALGFVLGYHDGVNLISFIFSAISTGGFAPVNDISMIVTSFPLNFILIVSMVLGATNFFVLAGLFKKRFKEFLWSETMVFIIIAIFSITLITLFFNLSGFGSAFHVISAMSASGFSYISMQSLAGNLKIYFIILMIIGGAGISTAGGIKIYRLLLILKSIKKAVYDAITHKDKPIRLFGKEYTDSEIIQAFILILIWIGIIFVSAFIVSSYGYDPVDSLFETASAIGTSGLSVGIVNASLVLELKWLFFLLMILGRVEILAFLIMISRIKETKILFIKT
ncbi:MAG: potassium transporter TrkG [Candidatus Thermoplasmatota archaeon]